MKTISKWRFKFLTKAAAFLLVSLFLGNAMLVADEKKESYSEDAGPYKVATLSETWTDAARDREVPVKIYYPEEGDGPFPVIVFSHGLGGTREGYEYLGRHWASYGYVSVHLQHKGSDDSVWKGKLKPMEAMRNATKDLLNSVNRPKDVSFVVDRLEKIDAESSPLKNKLDLKHLGMSGHSYGAWTTLAIAGESAAGLVKEEPLLADSRFKAAIAMSAPVPGSKRKELLDKAFSGVKIPVFHMTGTLDDSPIGETKASERRLPFDHIACGDQYLVTFNGGDHMIFGGRSRKIGVNKQDEVFRKYILISSTAFWDAYLKDDAKAKSWLAEGDFEKSLGKVGKFEKKEKKEDAQPKD
jgi:predicted dienelactone hydrolase